MYELNVNMSTVWSFREQRMQNETEAKEQKQREADVLRQKELENYIKEKEREILHLQVNLSCCTLHDNSQQNAWLLLMAFDIFF